MQRIIYDICGSSLLLFSLAANSAIVEFPVYLDGSQEVDGGDPDGTGTASLLIDDEALTIDWLFEVSNIQFPLTGAHIHEAPAGVNGPIEVDFSASLAGENLYDEDLAGVLDEPAEYYVNLHNSTYPGGAIRGQLSAPTPTPSPTPPTTQIPVPATLPLLIAGLGLLRLRHKTKA